MKLRTLAMALSLSVCGSAFAEVSITESIKVTNVQAKDLPQALSLDEKQRLELKNNRVDPNPKIDPFEPPKPTPRFKPHQSSGHYYVDDSNAHRSSFAKTEINKKSYQIDRDFKKSDVEMLSDKKRDELIKKYDKDIVLKGKYIEYLSTKIDNEKDTKRKLDITCGEFRSNLKDFIRTTNNAVPIYDGKKQRDLRDTLRQANRQLAMVHHLCR